MVGVEQVRVEAKKGTLHLAVVAHDASHHSREKVLPLLRAKRIDIIETMSADELGAAFGREQTAAVGITDAGLARGVRAIGLDTGRSE
ncbi:MAG TPA: ribosomal L7Ae/L30e/S12e/Gadd45 family protein [Gemmatimonadaceae bacterium]|nr:ribosomal L7Ae/L30e/S12e/Gadd45 family protein [Gemmatimonadaceae bacterium]